jgi:hypothetical protein
MNPLETQELGRFIVELKEKHKLTIFMIETPHGPRDAVLRPDLCHRLRKAHQQRQRRAKSRTIRASWTRTWGWPRMPETILKIEDLKVQLRRD